MSIHIQIIGVSEHEYMIAGIGPDAEQGFPVPHPATLVKDLTGFVHLGRLPGVVEDGSVAHGYGGIGALGV